MPSPAKQDIPKALWNVASTFTAEAQEAAIRKCAELQFDTNRGHISLEETLINLSDARDVIIDAVEKEKITQLPLKLQYALLEQLNAASDQLVAITNGKDAVLPLEAAVEELTASIWNYQLHNLSGEVLGLTTKMNQLKAQETLIRQASREATKLSEVKVRADELIQEIASSAKSAKDEGAVIGEVRVAIGELLKDANEMQVKAAGFAVLVQQNEVNSTQQLSSVNQSAANVQTTEKNIKEVAVEIEVLRSHLIELQSGAQQLMSSTKTVTEDQIETFRTSFTTLLSSSDTRIKDLAGKLDAQVADINSSMTRRAEASDAAYAQTRADFDARVSQLVTDTKALLDQDRGTQQMKLDGQLKEFGVLHQTTIGDIGQTFQEKVKSFETDTGELRKAQIAQFDGRVRELADLEGQIRQSIERATGFSLFHSFQTRQLDIASAKRFWAYALAVAVVISLSVSGVFIYELRYIKVYDAAFFLKLAISIPLIYAIAFCNVQYSRERRLEEEYAFKSSISISLDPYQRLVREVVDMDRPEEVAKYTAFIIDSVGKVFTSPTHLTFEGQAADVSTLQKLLKSVGDLIEPLVKALRK